LSCPSIEGLPHTHNGNSDVGFDGPQVERRVREIDRFRIG
jgi:hypothetical protein